MCLNAWGGGRFVSHRLAAELAVQLKSVKLHDVLRGHGRTPFSWRVWC